MDAGTLRVILLIAGIILVLGIYFWDKIKPGARHKQAVHPRVHRREPRMDESVGPWPEGQERNFDDLHEELGHLDVLLADDDNEPELEQIWEDEEETAPKSPAVQADLFGPALDDDDTPALRTKLPSMILQLNITARGKPFNGNDIARVAREMELEFGDMNIFHRNNKERNKFGPLFSLASMVEPGVFPGEDMPDFSTPGLTLFAQLPGPQDGMVVFSDMLFTAERIAAELNGELQDETHSVLSAQTIEHIQSQLREFRRQLLLAQRRQ